MPDEGPGSPSADAAASAGEELGDTGAPVRGAAGGDGAPGRAASADRGWRELLDLDTRLHAQRGLRLLTPEARVLLHLRLEGPVPVSTAMRAAGTSDRGFYAVLERLRQAGLVATVRDADDQRIRRLSLTETAPLASVRS